MGRLRYLLSEMTVLPLPGTKRGIVDRLQQINERPALAVLLGCQIVISCVSLVYAARYHYDFHVFYDPARLNWALGVVSVFSVAAYVFALAPFSFGYFVGFYFYLMVLGYLWLNSFSDLEYDHRLGGLSAAASAVVFLLPALLVTSPVKQRYAMSPQTFGRMLTLILALGAATVAVGALYSFKVVSLERIYDFREDLRLPLPLRYWIGIASNALLPFAFGCFVALRSHWKAALTLVLLLLFYPITLTKLTFFTPAWLLTIALLSRILTTRITVVVSLLLPMAVGAVLVISFGMAAVPVFDLVNFRMVGVPSTALDIYNDFFSRNDLTYFCQITFLKQVMACPYQEQLSVVMAKTYGLGNYNASLFATEGIASVGTLFAPVSVFACGLLIACANRLSSGLPDRLVLITGAIFPQILFNVPLSTTLLSHGALFLFLLWYVTPRSVFRPHDDLKQQAQAAAAR
jgi:hypothetical protein